MSNDPPTAAYYQHGDQGFAGNTAVDAPPAGRGIDLEAGGPALGLCGSTNYPYMASGKQQKVRRTCYEVLLHPICVCVRSRAH